MTNFNGYETLLSLYNKLKFNFLIIMQTEII